MLVGDERDAPGVREEHFGIALFSLPVRYAARIERECWRLRA